MSRWSTMCASYCCGILTLLAYLPVALARTDTFRRTSFDTMVHWDTETVNMLVDPKLSEHFGEQVARALHEAAQAWDVGGKVPRVALDHDVSETDRKLSQAGVVNWVGMAESWTYGDKLAVTVSTFDAESGVMIAAQIWLNPHRVFELDPDAATAGESYDFQAVLTHELGHVLGLGEAEDAPDATMYPTFYRGDTHQRTLSETDEEAIAELYALAASLRGDEPAGATCASAMPGKGRATAWSWLTVLALAVTTRDSRKWRSGFRRLNRGCAGLLACVRTEKSLCIHGAGGASATGTLIAQVSGISPRGKPLGTPHRQARTQRAQRPKRSTRGARADSRPAQSR